MPILESMQRKFTKRLCGLEKLSYNNRLILCNLPSLELRRLYADLVLCFKIVHCKVDLTFSDFFQFDSNIHNTRGNCLKLKLVKSNSKYKIHFFSNRVCPI